MTDHDVGALVRRHAIAAAPSHAPVVRRQAGARLETDDGSIWLDAATGGFGSGHAAVEAAILPQMRRVALSSRFLISRPLAEAVAALDRLCPDPLAVSYLCSSGAEALDASLKLAKGTHPRRSHVVALAGEDHGTLSHGLALGGRAIAVSQLSLRPLALPARDPDRVLAAVDRRVAAVVIAPAAPGRSLATLSPAWWRELQRRCSRAGALLVVDERTTGPARTGTGLAVEALGVVPDVVILGETLGADAIPLGAAVMTRKAYDRVYGRRNPSLHGSTFGANPLAAATLTAVLEVADGALAQRQRATAGVAARRLTPLCGPDRPIAAFGADGSLVWVRAATPATAHALVAALADERVLVREPRAGVVPVLPALTAAPADIDELFARITSAATALEHREGIAA